MGDEFDIDVNDLTTDEAAAPEPEPAGGSTPQEPPEQPPTQAVSARKPGPVGRLVLRISQFFSRITLPQWDLRSFLYVLVALIIAWLLLRNWPAVRIDLLVWRFDAPKSLVFLISLALGAVLLQISQTYSKRRVTRQEAEEPPPDNES